MRSAFFTADLSFPCPTEASPLDIRRTLRRWAALPPSSECFPWGLAKHLSSALCHPDASFAYAECVLFCCRESARRILNPLFNGYRHLILATVLRLHVQFAGIYYEHLRYWVTRYLLERGLHDWPECEGLSPLGYGPKHIGRAEIDANRQDLLGVIAETSRWFERTMGIIATHPNADDRVCGHELHHWIGGADLPPALSVPVLVESDGDSMLIVPDKDAAFPIIQTGWNLPEYTVDAHAVTSDPKPNLPVIEPVVFVETARPAPEPDIRSVAAKALDLATRLDDNPRVKAPNHLTVFRLYCVDMLSVREIARRCKCSHSTIINRKAALEKRLRLPLDAFRAIPDQVGPLVGAAEYARKRAP